jgi:excisionase family DNA binding protein
MSAHDTADATRWMSLEQAAAYAGIAPSQVTRARRNGSLGAVRLGYRTFVYKADDLDAWLSAQYVPATVVPIAPRFTPGLDVPLPAKRQRRRTA